MVEKTDNILQVYRNGGAIFELSVTSMIVTSIYFFLKRLLQIIFRIVLPINSYRVMGPLAVIILLSIY